MSVDLVVLNGGSSSGKSSIARCLQALLPQIWLSLGVDDLIDAMPPEPGDRGGEPAIAVGDDGTVAVGERFRVVETAWNAGLAAMARAGTGVIVDDVFLGGARSQERLRHAFGDLHVLWVGVHCDVEVAEARERARADRVIGMARLQAQSAHRGVHYDLEVDTSDTSSVDCAGAILARMS